MISAHHRVLTRRSVAAVLFGALAAGACTGGGSLRTDVSPESIAEFETLYRARMESARARFNEADVGFITGMISHHAQALVMAGLASSHGASTSVQTLCNRIINAQSDEIATMQQWLRDRRRPVPEVGADGTMPMTRGAGGPMLMPGMLTAEQLQELKNAHGSEFDRTFLTLMIQHHQGAVTMVHELYAQDGAAQGDLVFKLSSDIQVDQITEIDRMELMLEALPTVGNDS